MKPIIAVYPGTFDPVTLGHIDIIKRALRLCNQLVIGVAEHTGKDPLFSLEKRQAMIQSVISAEQLENVSVFPIKNLTVDFVIEHNASVIIRGLRTLGDFDHEFQMVGVNKVLNPDIETIFLAADLQTNFISSSVVRQVFAAGGEIKKFIHPSIINFF